MNYTELSGHPPDFEVRYLFYSSEVGGRQTGTPFQGYRCDWAYEGDDISQTGIYAIWPEFLTDDGKIFPEGVHVPRSGTANMWILNHALRMQTHRNRIMEGVKGYFMEGSRRVAEAVVTRIIGLHTNENVHGRTSR